MSTTFLLLPHLLIIHLSLSSAQILAPHRGLQGEWRLLHDSVGISAMHMQLLKNNKVVMFDRTDFGPSNLTLPGGRCRVDPNDEVLTRDCTAHSILYDIKKDTFRALEVQTDTWCSSGAVLSDGTLVQTGGYNDGDHVIRTLRPRSNSGWVEFPGALDQRRWYATDQILPDGRIIIVGGRAQFNYEYYPANSHGSVDLGFLRETRDESENNLYPFLHLLPDGNLFLFANTRSILFNYRRNRVVREFPAIPGEYSRNYPSTGSSVLLPLDENLTPLEPEIMICGGAPPDAFRMKKQRVFLRASSTCGRLRIADDREPEWRIEAMPMPRVMSDMVLLPNGDVMLINGAGSGSAGWDGARNPVTRPLIYNPNRGIGNRFTVMAASPRPRMYHSAAILVTDGRILVGGSNPHMCYNFTGVNFPTDLSLESFSPPYLSPDYDSRRPRIIRVDKVIGYKKPFSLRFTVRELMRMSVVSVRIVAPSFTTHSLAMNQRMVVLRWDQAWYAGDTGYRVDAFGPSTAEIAPPGYYLLFLVHSGIPSSGKWVRISNT